jgi:L,D-transpeptidase catalytic domain
MMDGCWSHGTNQPDSIGGFVSYGCIRMHNADVSDLYGRVDVGTTVGGDALSGRGLPEVGPSATTLG